MTPNEYQTLALRTDLPSYNKVHERFGGASIAPLVHAQLGVSSEAGELSDAVKKFLIYGQPLDAYNIMEESGDLLWYIARALECAGYTMEQAMQHNIDKLRVRYPEKFTEKDALERKDKL